MELCPKKNDKSNLNLPLIGCRSSISSNTCCISLHTTDVTGQRLLKWYGQRTVPQLDVNQDQIIMAEVCSWYQRGFLECGPSRGRTETVFLYACPDNISAHFKICSLSRSNLKEFEVILQRAGLDRVPLDEVKNKTTCLSLPSFWFRKVLEAFKVVPVSRAQKDRQQESKVVKQLTFLQHRKYMSYLG